MEEVRVRVQMGLVALVEAARGHEGRAADKEGEPGGEIGFARDCAIEEYVGLEVIMIEEG